MLSLSNLSRISNKQNNVESLIAQKLATGKFIDTGAKYTPEQARADASNSSLRLTASIDASGKLAWRK